MERGELCRKYAAFMSGQKEFSEARSIVFNNGFGDIWLIQESVYKNLAHILHAIPQSPIGFKFIVQIPTEYREMQLPRGWELTTNGFGNPKFISKEFTIDYIPLNNINSIQRRGLNPSIESYLTGTSLTVDSIAFNVLTQQVVGEIGIRAIFDRSVGVNDDVEAEIEASKKGKTVEQYLQERARDLRFRAVMG